jgi:hypothetical protein
LANLFLLIESMASGMGSIPQERGETAFRFSRARAPAADPKQARSA